MDSAVAPNCYSSGRPINLQTLRWLKAENQSPCQCFKVSLMSRSEMDGSSDTTHFEKAFFFLTNQIRNHVVLTGNLITGCFLSHCNPIMCNL